MHYLTHSPQQTQALANKILTMLKGKNLICLYGELGSGKTTFVQGLAKALGIKKRVVSPTFIIMREYKISKKLPITNHPASPEGGQSPITNHYLLLTHLDCYRLETERDITSINFQEIWSDHKNLVVIEWAEKLKAVLPKSRIEIKFEYVNKNERKINIDG